MIILAGLELHLPFHHRDSLDFLELVNATYKPDAVVCVGDLFDVHANSRHDHDPDGSGSGDELEEALLAAEDVYNLFPTAFLCVGNHDKRIEKAAYKAGITKRALRGFEEIYEIPDTWTVGDYFILDEVCYEHGDRFGAGAMSHVKAAVSNMRSTVIGHTHTSFGVEFMANRDKLIFGACAGALLDPDSYAASYARAYAKKGILGAIIVRDGTMVIPVPMILDSYGRWTGNI